MKKIFKGLGIVAASTALCVGIGVTAGCSGYNGTYTGEYSYTNEYGATYGMRVEVTVENNIITGIKDITNTADSLKTQSGYVQDWAQGGKYVYKESDVEWHIVSPGWEDYFAAEIGWLLYTTESKDSAGNYIITTETNVHGGGKVEAGKQYYRCLEKGCEGDYVEYDGETIPSPAATAVYSYSWTNSDASNWTKHEAWLLQQYVGWSVADVLDISVYYNNGYVANADGSSLVPSSSVAGEPYDKAFNDAFNASGLLIANSTQGSGRLILAVQNALSK